MTREIKFRAWDNIELKMINDTYNIFEQGPNIYIMQYTGLKDKNGLDIYEGDIIRLYQKAHIFLNTKVVFKNGGFELRALHNDRIWMFWDIIVTNKISLEIIGNIYEDNHLLTK